MIFKKHLEWDGKHSILSASKPAWLNYTDETLFDYVDNLSAAAMGTKKHEYARMAIELGIKQANTMQTLNSYINDCIGYRMRPEQVLFHSPYAFGTADAISFRKEIPEGYDQEAHILRIFDLKTGTGKVSGTQLAIYAAYFCLEYEVRPFEIEYDLRIYQNDEIIQYEVDGEEIAHIMHRIKELSKLIAERVAQGV